VKTNVGFCRLLVSVVKAVPKSHLHAEIVSPAGAVLRSLNCVTDSSQVFAKLNAEAGRA